jgi:Xaa-Pro aminopeptidase
MEHGAEKPGFVLLAAGKENYNCLSGKATDRKLKKGEMLWVDMGCIYDGYWTDYCRSIVLGKPSKKQIAYQREILDVNDAGIAAIKVGEPVKRVAEAAQHVLDTLGYGVKIGQGRVGHGMGLNSTEPPHTALYEDTIMKEGLVITLEPRFINDSGVYNCEEVLHVTKKGADVLTTTKRELSATN